ncbi:glycoside hydrolase family 127 protein [Microbacterium nanhaiense]|uniref:glycoside hydrolase family 127 protein n=1 Tax=Microbacterium nanhaiense TaxID=1301026 RepID=UPI00402B4DB7
MMTITSHTPTPIAPVVPSTGALRPLGLDAVSITGGFWAERQDVNRRATLAHIAHWLEREGWIRNFDLAASGTLPAGRRGREFSDSEVYKYLEAVAWELGRAHDDDLERSFRATVSRVAAAQEADGYLNTRFGREGQSARWSDLEWGHELYCLGHLFQAAVARARTAPGSDDGLLEVAVRAADLVCEVFGEDGIASVCGHPEIETGLVELARVTGSRRYVEQAKLFVDRRGTGVLRPIEFGQAYFQDDQPVREATVLRGHAVRANYLSAGAADAAAETGDEELLGALATQWDNTVARRTYITGGQGAHHQDEAFGADFELPSDRAYSETCAGVASVQFSWRLLLARGGAHYADLIERTLYNVVATSPSSDGTAFYYANTLQQRTPGEPADPDTPSARAESSLRAPWFDVSCCPPNVARTFASLASYLATTDGAGVQLHQYAPATVRTPLDGGAFADFAVATEYPADGAIVVTIGEGSSGEWTLALRVPAWAEGSTAELRTARGAEPLQVAPGYLEVRREFRAGDTVTLHLPLAPRLTHPDPRIDAIRGTVAVERGPEVLALESVDLGSDVADAEILTDEPLREEDGRVTAAISLRRRHDAGWPYGAAAPDDAAPETLRVPLVAYHEWAERGPSTMRIWVPEAR